MTSSAQILQGDALNVLRTVPAESVNCVVTSPPYWNLRDYGVSGQLGLEQTPELYINAMVEVFQEVRRVLRSDGTLWLNMGDSYSYGTHDKRSFRRDRAEVNVIRKPLVNLKSKNLLGIPWHLAFALQSDGWYLRQDIIWNKSNPRPESVRDRCTKAHEYLFLFSKNKKYYWNFQAMQEPSVTNDKGLDRYPTSWDSTSGSHREKIGRYPKRGPGNWKVKPVGMPGENMNRGCPSTAVANGRITRNRRSVWTIPTKGYKGAHFATFPPALVQPCILAGCPPGGITLDPFCGTATVGEVALRYGRRFIGIDLDPNSIILAHQRLEPFLIQPDFLVEAQ